MAYKIGQTRKAQRANEALRRHWEKALLQLSAVASGQQAASQPAIAASPSTTAGRLPNPDELAMSRELFTRNRANITAHAAAETAILAAEAAEVTRLAKKADKLLVTRKLERVLVRDESRAVVMLASVREDRRSRRNEDDEFISRRGAAILRRAERLGNLALKLKAA